MQNPQAGAAFSALGDKADFPALGFRGDEDVFHKSPSSHQEAEDVFAASNFSLIEAYAEGRANVVVELVSADRAAEYYLVFGAIVGGIDRNDVAGGVPVINTDYRPADPNGNQLFVPVITELVHCPERIIRSFVWVERAEKGDNRFRDIIANLSAVDEVVEFNGTIGDGELRPLGIGLAGENGGSVPGLIKSESDGLQSLSREKSAAVGELLTELEFQALVSGICRIDIAHQVVGLVCEKCPDLPFQLRNVFVGSRESAARAIKGAVFIPDDGHGKARSDERP